MGGGGDVGTGRPTVRALTNRMTTSLASTLADQPRDAAGIDPVIEPMYYSGSTADNTVTEQHRADAAPAAVAEPEPRNPTHDYICAYVNGNVQFFLAARRRVKTMRTKFVISSDPARTSRNDAQCMGILRQVFRTRSDIDQRCVEIVLLVYYSFIEHTIRLFMHLYLLIMPKQHTKQT